MQVCLIGDSACPDGRARTPMAGADIRFTNVDLVLSRRGTFATGRAVSFGLGFTFSGQLDGNFLFDFLLSDLDVNLPADTFISGNMSLELKVDGVYTSSFLPFDTRSGLSFGPVPPIAVSGSNVPYTALRHAPADRHARGQRIEDPA